MPTRKSDSKPTNSPPPSRPRVRFDNYRDHSKSHKEEARIRLGVTLEMMKGVKQITHTLKHASGGVKACIAALRGDDSTEAIAFLEKWDSLSESDRKLLTVEEICVSISLKPRRLYEVICGTMQEQGADAEKLIVASERPAIVKRMVKEAKSALGEKDRENFLRGKDVDWFVPTKGMTLNLDNSKTQNILNAGGEERALPPPKADDFLLEVSATMRPDAPQLLPPEPIVTARVPDVIEGEYADV